jgi:hypothetical protein
MGAQWRAIRVTTRLELAVEKRIRKRLGVETFCPYRMRRSHRRGSPIVRSAYFPGYLFADLEAVWIDEVLAVRGVRSVIGARSIPQRVMVKLIGRADAQGLIVEPLEPGRYYQLQRPGALGQLVAKVDRLDGRKRARVFLRLLGVEIPASVLVQDLHFADPVPP